MLRPTRGGRAALRPIVDRRRDAGRLGEPSVPIAVRNAQAPIVHRPIVTVGVITPPLDPLPVQGGDGCWVLSPTPFRGTQSSIVHRPRTNNHKPTTTFPDVGTAFRPVRPARNTRRRHSPHLSSIVNRLSSCDPIP